VDVAAALATDREPLRGRYQRLAVVFVALAAGVGGAWFAASRLRAPKPAHEAAEEIDRSHWLAPIKTAAEGDEEVAPFAGFAISVETDPAGALVSIAGVPRGEAPVLAGVECTAGKPVEIRAEKRGFPVVVTNTTCRSDALVKLVLRLSR
jgi:hypothetical protein